MDISLSFVSPLARFGPSLPAPFGPSLPAPFGLSLPALSGLSLPALFGLSIPPPFGLSLSKPWLARWVVCLVAACSSAPVFARRATYFLCWCKESRQRKHPEHQPMWAVRFVALCSGGGLIGIDAPLAHAKVGPGAEVDGTGRPGTAGLNALATASAARKRNRVQDSPLSVTPVPIKEFAAGERLSRKAATTAQSGKPNKPNGLVLRVLSLLTFFAPAKKVSRLPGETRRAAAAAKKASRPPAEIRRAAASSHHLQTLPAAHI